MSNQLVGSNNVRRPMSTQFSSRVGAIWRWLRLLRARRAANSQTSFAEWGLNVIRATQLARMNSVLLSMPDHILEEIGVSREDVPAYARSLVYEQQNPVRKSTCDPTSTKSKTIQKAD